MRQRYDAGFTLLELMVVVALVGLMLTVVVSSIGDGGRQNQMENEARRLVAVVKLARDQAVLMSEEISLVIEDRGYRFDRLGAKQWEPITDDHVLAHHTLYEQLRLEPQLEAYAFTPKRKNTKDSDKPQQEDNAVRIYLLSSGEIEPFTLYIKQVDQLNGVRFKVTADQEGKISWQGPLEDGAS